MYWDLFAYRCGHATFRGRRHDPGKSRMRSFRTSGSTSGDWKRRGLSVRPTCYRASRRLYPADVLVIIHHPILDLLVEVADFSFGSLVTDLASSERSWNSAAVEGTAAVFIQRDQRRWIAEYANNRH